MTDDLDEYDDLDEEQDSDDNLVRRLRQSQRAAKKEAKQYREDAEAGKAARLELIKLQANLPDNKMVTLFLNNYDGPLTKDAVMTAAREYELIGPDPQEQEQEQQVGDVEKMMAAHDGGAPPPAPGTDDALMAQIRNVKTTGDEAAYEIAKILKDAGRFHYDDD